MTACLPIPLLLVTVTALIMLEERTMPGAPRNIRWVLLWKPLSTLLIILIAALSFMQPNHDPGYSTLILVGLILSLAGDVLLIFHAPRAFLVGLVAFLCAHLAYIAAFIQAQRAFGLSINLMADIIAAVVLALIGGAMFSVLRPGLGKMRLPVLLYILVISTMLHRALSVAFAWRGVAFDALLMVFGALLFYISDAILAFNRFRMDNKMPHGRAYNLSTYYAGQLLLALSAVFFML